MLQAKASLVLVSLLALGATGCGHRLRRVRVVQVPVYVPTVVIYTNGQPGVIDHRRAEAERRAQDAAREQAAREAAEAAEAEQRAQEQAAREQAAREQAAREQAARELAAREAAEAAAREQAAREQAEAAARAKAAQQGSTTIIIVGPGGAPPQGRAKEAAPGVWITNE